MRARNFAVLLFVGLTAGCGTQAHLATGDRYFAKGEYVAAIYEYGKVLEKEDHPEAALRRACALKMMGHDEAAEGDLVRAARAGSTEAKALLGASQGAADISALQKVVEQYPDSAWVWALFGDCLLQDNQPDAAAKTYEEALKRGPKGRLAAAVLYNLTLAHIRAGDCQAATRSFVQYRTVADQPMSDADRYLAGLLAYARGDYAAAAAEWRTLPAGMRERIRQTLPGEETLASVE